MSSRLIVLILTCLATANAFTQPPRRHTLNATPKTVVWGYYDASVPPVLRIQSGDLVDVQTLIVSTPARLEAAGLPAADIEPALHDVDREVKERGPAPHILTGPVYVEGAEPGNVLEVRILSIELAIPYALNSFRPGLGTLPEDYPYARARVIPLDLKRRVARFAEGIEVPLQPFFGSIGVAPPLVSGRVSAAPPWIHAGNLDNKHLVAGTTLYIPVHAPGALLLIGDGHAAQGDGEVDLSALETSLRGTVQLIVRKDMRLGWPRAETPTHYMTMGLHQDLDEAAKLAVREMVDFLVTQKGLSRDDAYMLSSIAADLAVTQLVDGTKGIHATIPKSIFMKP